MEKVCITCGISKNVIDFVKCKICKTGVSNQCKSCKKAYNNKWKSENSTIVKEYGIKYGKIYRENHKKPKKPKLEPWKNRHPGYSTEYTTKRLKNDITFKLTHYLRKRTRLALKSKGIRKSNKNLTLLGCTSTQFKDYIQSKFLPTMTWENYGKYWHIDHIIPCSKFDLTKEEEQKKCFHYTNLQPLFAVTQVINGKEYIGNLNKLNKML